MKSPSTGPVLALQLLVVSPSNTLKKVHRKCAGGKVGSGERQAEEATAVA